MMHILRHFPESRIRFCSLMSESQRRIYEVSYGFVSFVLLALEFFCKRCTNARSSRPRHSARVLEEAGPPLERAKER